MKTLILLLFIIPMLAYSQSDRPRSLNANNSTNSTPGDWVDANWQSKARTPDQAKKAADSDSKKTDAKSVTVLPPQGRATENRKMPTDKSVKDKNVPGSKKSEKSKRK